MPPKRQSEPLDVVEIDSSDDENAVEVERRTANASPGVLPSQSGSLSVPPSQTNYRPLESRSFWKAGAYDVGPTKLAPVEGELEHARVHPKFLHSNATSHKWAFGAIAELLDNAVDEICNGSTFVKVDRIYNLRDNSPALLFQDDGGGMDPDCIRKCMSLGYSSKKSNTTIGQYGNGFKTSTMRLGADVIVFSRSSRKATQSIGLLSYTFLRRTGQDDVIVPMVDFDISDNWAEPIIYSSKDDWSANLNTILEWSPFPSKDHLMQQFEDIGSHGTKLIIYNLWMNDEGIFELNFDDDDEDIRLRDEANRENSSKTSKRIQALQAHISYRIRFSLRAYASMLYLRRLSSFKIILRGKPVEQFNIADELKYPKVITYRPQLAATAKEVTVEATLGFIKEAPALGICGFNVYHKNRLIRPFWKVTADGSSKGNGVVGVLEANFIEPAHDKQDFERSSPFFRLETKMKQMIMEYWNGHCHLIGHPPVGVHYPKKVSGVQPPSKQIIGVAGSVPVLQNLGDVLRSNYEIPASFQSTDLAAVPAEELEVDGVMSKSIDDICEENIQLFMRCEAHSEKEKELKQTIEELEKELEETKRKCALLSSNIESKRRLKLLKQQVPLI